MSVGVRCLMLLFGCVLSACQQPYDAIINLGGDCQVAYQLHLHGLRSYALPFDAWITSYDSLQSILKNKFEGFLEASNFTFVDEAKNNGVRECYILDQKYDVRIIHEGKTLEEFQQNYQEIRQKYQRRITRFFDFIESSVYPLFIRKTIAHDQPVTKSQALALRDTLAVLRNGRPFMLLVVSSAEEAKEGWQDDQVCHCYLRQPTPYTWQGDPEAWEEIFNNMGLTVIDKKPTTDGAS